MKRIFLVVLFLLSLAAPAVAKFGFVHVGIVVSTISGVALSNGNSFTTPAAANSTLDTISATCSAGACSGATFALSTSGSCSSATANSDFSISSGNLNVGITTISSAGSYPIGIAVMLPGATNSGTCYPLTLTGSAQTIASVSYSPSPGTCITGAANTCTTLSVSMSPASPGFSGTFAIATSGCTGSDDDTNFSVGSTSGVVAISNTSVAAGSYTPCVKMTESGIGNSPYYQTVSITVQSNTGTACGYGQTYVGSLPTEATEAGFTTCAANWVFSNSLYATQSNWLDCNDNTPSLPWKLGGTGFPSAPCNINQVTDPTYGNTVMDLKYLTSYGSNEVQMATGDISGSGDREDFGNMYVEATYRLDATNGSAGDTSPEGVWSVQPNNSNFLELDFGELYGGVNPGGYADGDVINHGPNGGGNFTWATWLANNLPSGYNLTQYHKYGVLLTSNGSTSQYACGFVDDILQSCLDTNAENNSPQLTQRNLLIAWAIGSSSITPVNHDIYLENISVFSCSGWSSSMCNGSTLYNSGGLTYWH